MDDAIQHAPASLSANWHTHTFRCRHASGDFADYAAAAREAGISVLGVSDHCPLPDDRAISVRMAFSELQGYIDGFRAARDAVPGVELHLGVELEHWIDLVPDYPRELLARGVEYVVGAPHHFHLRDGTRVQSWDVVAPELQPRYAREYGDFVEGMIESGLYAFIAHPDLLGCFCDRWSPECEEAARKIARASLRCGIPLEVNGWGLGKKPVVDAGTGLLRHQYPWEPFWKAVGEEGATVLVNSDAHAPRAVACNFGEALAMCSRCGIVPKTFRSVSGNRLR